HCNLANSSQLLLKSRKLDVLADLRGEAGVINPIAIFGHRQTLHPGRRAQASKSNLGRRISFWAHVILDFGIRAKAGVPVYISEDTLPLVGCKGQREIWMLERCKARRSSDCWSGSGS